MQDYIETFLFGFFGTIVLGAILLIIAVLCIHPIIIVMGIGVGTLIYAVGWCMKHYEDFKALLRTGKFDSSIPAPIVPYYKIPILDGLDRLEKKYNITTIHFMYFVYTDKIPYNMDNLDYIEWLGLVNELSSIRSVDQQKEGK